MTTTSTINTTAVPVPTTSILDRLSDKGLWEEFIGKKEELDVNSRKAKHFRKMLSNDKCTQTILDVSGGKHIFSVPKKKLISKFHSGKKRTVYTYRQDEMLALRLLSFALHDYDHLFSDALYSFRSGYGVRDAIRKLRFTEGIDTMYGYKADIHNYFNSIDVGMLISSMRKELDDTRLVDLFDSMLSDRRAEFEEQIIEEDKGVMAGTPISPFLANYFLRDVDEYFLKKDCIYMRYADDILILAKDQETLASLRDDLLRMISEKRLEMNPKKEQYFQPGEKFNFLGFSISKERVDISPVTVEKMKGKIKRSSRAIRRWMLEKKAPVNGTIRAMIRTYDTKFFGFEDSELSWARWYFPSITTDESLREIDNYLQDRIRYIATGKFNKRNYEAFTYEMMKECGYRTLVGEYYSSLEPKKE